MKFRESQIERTITVCPYCMNEWSDRKDIFGCCGEINSEEAFVIDGEAYLDSEVEIEEGVA